MLLVSIENTDNSIKNDDHDDDDKQQQQQSLHNITESTF